jgi:carboxymethylenebutenolidase
MEAFRLRYAALALLCFAGMVHSATPASPAERPRDAHEMVFPSGSLQLHGFLLKPEGAGPFPTVIWNHGSEEEPGFHAGMAQFYVSHSYAYFAPHRRGQGKSPGRYIMDEIRSGMPWTRDARMVELQVEHNKDVIAALDYLKSQQFVDTNRIAVTGCSFGGIQTLLTGEHATGVRALVAFAPGAMSWERAPALQARLKRAVTRAKVPILLLQAANDFSLAPSRELSREAEVHHVDFRAKVYPPLGSTPQEGHGKFCRSFEIWGQDVLDFLHARMK